MKADLAEAEATFNINKVSRRVDVRRVLKKTRENSKYNFLVLLVFRYKYLFTLTLTSK